MSRRATDTKPTARRRLGNLLDVRDEIAKARDLVAAAYMACHALALGSSERSALSAVTNASRETLEAALDRLDRVSAAAK